jgi:hypothetical protein
VDIAEAQTPGHLDHPLILILGETLPIVQVLLILEVTLEAEVQEEAQVQEAQVVDHLLLDQDHRAGIINNS